MKLIISGFLMVLVLGSYGQEKILRGVVFDTIGLPVQGVSIAVRNKDSLKIIAFGISRADGSFFIIGLPGNKGKMTIDFRHISFETVTLILDIDDPGWINGFRIQLTEKATALKEVVITGEVPVLIRSDTIVFNANNYREAEVKKVEDLLKKIQGFSVDPNGRLSFNGKPVEKVLIDGDDLADKAYQLITKNLDAVTIDKVEVINNFSDNRLLRNVVESNKVGVNLKISSKFKSKFSGGAEVGISVERRYNADMNTIFIRERSKWLMFGNSNNVARDPSGNSGYYYQQEGGQGNPDETLLSGPMILEAGCFVLPAVGERYTRDNKDFAYALMNSWRIGKKNRVNGMISFNDLSWRSSAEGSVLTAISDQDQWLVYNQMNMNNRSKDFEARVSMQKDAGKDHVSRYDLIINGGKQKNMFSNWTRGTISDSLLENLGNGMKGIGFNWQETLLAGKEVLQLQLNLGYSKEQQELKVRSSRYLGYWGLDSSYLYNRQDLAKNKNYCQFTGKVNGQVDRLQYEYGVRSEYRKLGYISNALISSMESKPDLLVGDDTVVTRVFGIKAMARLGIKTGSKGLVGVSGESGWETLVSGFDKNNFISIRAGLGYARTFSLLSSLRINYTVRRGYDQYDKFYPDELISGNGAILNGLQFKGPELSHGLIVSIHSNNIYRQRNWSANFSFMSKPQRYAGGIEAEPEFSLHFFELTHVNHTLNAGFNWEGYVRNIRGKLGSKLSFNSSQYESVVNRVNGVSAQSGFRMEGWWVSGFPWPVNAELKSLVIYSTGRWNHGELNRNWQYEWSCKMKFRPGRSFYSALMWHGHKLSPKKIFQGADLFASYKLGSSLQLTLTGSNLLNTGRLLDKTVMPYSSSETGYELVRRYLLISVNWRF